MTAPVSPNMDTPGDQASVGSYQSDGYTLPGDDVDSRSVSSVSSHDSYDSYCPEDPLPSYRVPKDQGVSQDVYEAWILYRSPDTREILTKTKICGVKVWSEYEDIEGFMTSRTEPHEQDELKEMTLAAIDRYQTSNKRCLPSRVIRGRAKSYQEHLDDRVRQLPGPVQSEIDRLLSDREVATSNRFHRRDWTVVMMREQLHYRFADAAYQEVKKHKMRFWKNKHGKQPIEHFVIVKGSDGMVATDDKGLRIPRRHGNPWKVVDEEEMRAKERARYVRHHGKDGIQLPRGDVRYSRPRDRSFSPLPTRYPHMRRSIFDRSRSVSPAPPPFPLYNGPRFGGPMGMASDPFAHPHPPPPPDSYSSPWMRCPAMNTHVPPPPEYPPPFRVRPSYMPFSCPPGPPMPPPPPPPTNCFRPPYDSVMHDLNTRPRTPPLLPFRGSPSDSPYHFNLPPTPRPGNLSTPSFSPATTDHTGSSASSAGTTPPHSDDAPAHLHETDAELVFGDERQFKDCRLCVTRLVVLGRGPSDGTAGRGWAFARAARRSLARLQGGAVGQGDEAGGDDGASEILDD